VTSSSLKERFERLERTPGEPPITSGSSAAVLLLPPEHLPELKTISAIKSLHRRGVRLPLAKAVIEDLARRPAQDGSVHVPHIEDRAAFENEMAASGVAVVFLRDPRRSKSR
jgi:hypothetical protein